MLIHRRLAGSASLNERALRDDLTGCQDSQDLLVEAEVTLDQAKSQELVAGGAAKLVDPSVHHLVV